MHVFIRHCHIQSVLDKEWTRKTYQIPQNTQNQGKIQMSLHSGNVFETPFNIEEFDFFIKILVYIIPVPALGLGLDCL
jgi:hypothetical protein